MRLAIHLLGLPQKERNPKCQEYIFLNQVNALARVSNTAAPCAYIEIDHRENFGTEFPKCAAYKVIVSAVENACDGCGANLGGWRGWLGFPF
jgi:hypothetical protein